MPILNYDTMTSQRYTYTQNNQYSYNCNTKNNQYSGNNSNTDHYASTQNIPLQNQNNGNTQNNLNGNANANNDYEINIQSVRRAIQYWLDKSTIHIVPRWSAFGTILALFFLRIYLIQGYFIVAYGLGIFLLNNFIAFLSPLEDPTDVGGSRDDGLSLPSTSKEGKEYRPFARRLPEFKFWLACTRGVGTAIVMTFFSVFDVPVFWPILLMYFFVLFFMTMKRQIEHMWKHKYKDAGKEKGEYGGGMSGSIGQTANTGSYGGAVNRRR